MPPLRSGPTDLMDTDISFPLHRLFDDCNLDHIKESERMKVFKHRDLPHVKHYKAAVKIFGGPLSRKRVIIAPPMETNIGHRIGLYYNQPVYPEAPKITSELKPQVVKDALEYDKKEIQTEIEKDKTYQYKKWIEERQKFRNDLDNMGLNEEWLQKKPNKTALEKRVLSKMKEERAPKDEVVIKREETNLQAEITSIPNVKVPCPIGIRILELFLKKNKMRLIDLFKQADKDKNWKLSRDELRQAIRSSRVPLSEALLEDLVLSLDIDNDDNLDYKEMARGLEQWRHEKRENKRKSLSRESTSLSSKGNSSESDTPRRISTIDETYLPMTDEKPGDIFLSNLTEHTIEGPLNNTGRKSTKSSENLTNVNDTVARKQSAEGREPRAGSAKESGGPESQRTVVSTQSRSSTPHHLQPPEMDTRPEQMLFASEEAMVDLRKRDREALKVSSQGRKGSPKKTKEDPPGIIKIGDKAIDNHCMKSTLQGESSSMIDKFRQLKLKEYYEITKICEKQGISLNKKLLERVLLHPPDHPHGVITKRIAFPGVPLLSSHYADPPKRPKTPIEVKHKDKVRRTKSGKLLIDSRHKYPQKSTVAPTGTKETLSTGRAVIRRKVDCWMTFEEYDRLTSHLAIRYQQLHGATNMNAFWPGHLLDKVRLCMPPYDQPELADKSETLFENVRRSKSVYPGMQRENSAWPINEGGYMQSGIYDPFARKYTVL